jgi:hypothetical protein
MSGQPKKGDWGMRGRLDNSTVPRALLGARPVLLGMGPGV